MTNDELRMMREGIRGCFRKRIMNRLRSGTVLLALFVFPVIGFPQGGSGEVVPKTMTRILFVFDASGSMADPWQSDTKYRAAVKVLTGILDSLRGQQNLEVGLRVYGPKRAPGPDCQDSYIMVPFGQNNFSDISRVLNDLNPGGTTPIAYSLERTVSDFTPCDHCRNVVILITDGLEACGGDPCEVSRSLQRQGIFLRPFIVGIGKELGTHFRCMGNYFDAASERDYRRALQTIVATTLKGATAQVSLLDQHGNPTQTNVQVTLYDHATGRAKYSFIHTLNESGLPDTLKPDPLVTYDVVVQTIPPLNKEEVWIEPGQHTTITLNAPQGYLSFLSEDGRVVPCIIRRTGSGEAIHVQPSDRVEKYLAGNYDITVLAIPRMNFNTVEIKADQGTRLRIPACGTATLKYSVPVAGSLYFMQAGDLLWVGHLRSDQPQEELQLQPGTYWIIYREQSSKRQADTKQKEFRMEPGQEIEIPL
ncbi:MAG: VWA domain-containing protein [Bacteroidetes bacterium]|nr:MAG: VWA domain-containing protein [Bacteroidota bacterium]